MRKKTRLFLVYFPVILIAGQVLVNLLSFIAPKFYLSNGFYLNTFFGTNVFFAVFLLTFTFMFKFCAVSRWAAIAECLFAVNYLIVGEDNLYNIMFQVIVGILALIVTFGHYIKKFPLCRISLLLNFLKNVTRERSCEKGLEKFDRQIQAHLLKKYRHLH